MSSETLTVKELETRLNNAGIDLKARQIRNIADKGFYPLPVSGDWEYEVTVLGLIRYYRNLREDQGGTFAAERLRETTERADKLQLENAKTRGELVELDAVYKHFEGLFVALRSRILSSSLMPEEKDQLLIDLMKLTARDVADKSPQSNADRKPAKSIRAGDDSQPAIVDSRTPAPA